MLTATAMVYSYPPCPAAIKTIAAPAGSSTAADGLKIVEKAKAAVSAVKVASALDAIAGLLEASLAGKPAAAAGADGAKGQALKSVDTLANLSAYLTLYRYPVVSYAVTSGSTAFWFV
jgi:hypothetical protein